MKRILLLLSFLVLFFSCDKKDPVNTEFKDYLQGNWVRIGNDVQGSFFRSTVIFNDDIMVWKDSISADTSTFQKITVREGYCKVEYTTKEGKYHQYFNDPDYADWPNLLIVRWSKKSQAKITTYIYKSGKATLLKEYNSTNIVPPILSGYSRVMNQNYVKFVVSSTLGNDNFELNFVRKKSE